MKRIALSIMFLLFSQILSAQLLDTISFSLNDYTFESLETYTRILGPESTYTEMGRKILDLREIPSGIYLVTMRCQGQRHTEKLVIAR